MKWEAGVHILIGNDRDIKHRPERTKEKKEKEPPGNRYYRTREDDLMELETGEEHFIKVQDKETSKREEGKLINLCKRIEEGTDRAFEVTGENERVIIKRIR